MTQYRIKEIQYRIKETQYRIEETYSRFVVQRKGRFFWSNCITNHQCSIRGHTDTWREPNVFFLYSDAKKALEARVLDDTFSGTKALKKSSGTRYYYPPLPPAPSQDPWDW